MDDTYPKAPHVGEPNTSEIATKLATGLAAGVSVIQAAVADRRPFVRFARLTQGVSQTACDLRMGGRIMRGDGFDAECFFVGKENEALDVNIAGTGSDGSYLVTYGLLAAGIKGTSE